MVNNSKTERVVGGIRKMVNVKIVSGAQVDIPVREDINVETLGANKTLTAGTDKINQYLDEGGTDRVITLATAGATAGDRFVIRHNGAFNDINCLEVKQGAATLDKVFAGAIKEYIFDGTNWRSRSTGTGENDNKKYNVAIGYSARGYDKGVAIGYKTWGKSVGVAIGYQADGCGRGVAVGYDTDADTYGTAVGGFARGRNYGVAVGIEANTDSKKLAIAIGYAAKCFRVAETAINITGACAQKFMVTQGRWAGTTTNNTPAEILCGETPNERFTIRAKSALAFTILAVARDNVNNHVAAYKIEGLIKRDGANNTTLSWSNKTVQHEDDATWDIAVTADDVNESLKIEVTGDATNPTQWAVRLDGVETVFL